MKRIAIVLLALAPAAAGAEEGFDGQTRHAVHDGSGGFATWGAESLDPGAIHVGFAFDHARNPVVLQAGGDFVVPVVSRASTVEIGAFYGLPFGLEAGVAIPATMREMPTPLGLDGEGDVAANGMGDVRAELKWRALSPRGVIPGIAIAAGSTLPTGDGRGWSGAGVAQPTVTLIAEENLGPVRVLANAGYRVYTGEGESAWDVKQGDVVFYRGAAAWATPFRDVTIIGEALGATTAGGGPAPMEAGVGIRAPIVKGLVASAGANVGLSESIGTPAWRAFGAIAWTFGAGSKPRVPERRPTLAEATPKPAATPKPKAVVTATPKPVSTAVAAATPKPSPATTAAPLAVGSSPSDALGRARLNAREGLASYNKGDYTNALAKFQAALQSEALLLPAEKVLLHKYIAYCEVAFGRRQLAKAAFQSALSIDPGLTLNPNAVSPKIVEVFEEAKAERSPVAVGVGTPVIAAEPASLVIVRKERIELSQNVHFANGTAEILIDSYPLLDAVVKAMQEHPEIVLLRVEGYTDATGDAKKNLALSKARAKSVREYLVRKGVAPVRVISDGYGPARPIASNQTPEGRAKNRRVEFHILARKDAP